MTNDSFDRALMDQMGQLPPVPGELDLCTPWHSAVGRILWGLALCTFRLEVFYLQYLLPLLGATLLYLGYRSLRRENRWFHLGWIMAGITLYSGIDYIIKNRAIIAHGLTDNRH